MALFIWMCGPAAGAVPEYEVKTALIYKIGKFVRWPEGVFASHAGTIKVCLIGRDDFGPSIDSLAGQKLQGQVITVARMAASEQGVADCQIAFFGRSEQANLAEELATLSRLPILTISDIEGFAAQGGMVGFATSDSKVSFQINPLASRRVGLDIGAQLLQFATLVTDDHSGVKP